MDSVERFRLISIDDQVSSSKRAKDTRDAGHVASEQSNNSRSKCVK